MIPEPTPVLDRMTGKLTATERRHRYVDQLNDLLTIHRYTEMIILMTECRQYGRSRGWLGSCNWFENQGSGLLIGDDREWRRIRPFYATASGEDYVRWVAVQSLVWFAREA